MERPIRLISVTISMHLRGYGEPHAISADVYAVDDERQASWRGATGTSEHLDVVLAEALRISRSLAPLQQIDEVLQQIEG